MMKILRLLLECVLIGFLLVLFVFTFVYMTKSIGSEMATYNRQVNEIERLENYLDETIERQQELAYRYMLLFTDKDLYYETILREDHGLVFKSQGETRHIIE